MCYKVENVVGQLIKYNKINVFSVFRFCPTATECSVPPRREPEVVVLNFISHNSFRCSSSFPSTAMSKRGTKTTL